MEGQEQVRTILEQLSLSQYADLLIEEGFDTPVFLHGITEEDCEAIGIKKGHKRALMHYVTNNVWRPAVSVPLQPPATPPTTPPAKQSPRRTRRAHKTSPRKQTRTRGASPRAPVKSPAAAKVASKRPVPNKRATPGGPKKPTRPPSDAVLRRLKMSTPSKSSPSSPSLSRSSGPLPPLPGKAGASLSRSSSKSVDLQSRRSGRALPALPGAPPPPPDIDHSIFHMSYTEDDEEAGCIERPPFQDGESETDYSVLVEESEVKTVEVMNRLRESERRVLIDVSMESSTDLDTSDLEDQKVRQRVNTQSGQPLASSPHLFKAKSFRRPTFCAFCGGFIWGLLKQGYTCSQCMHAVHRKCLFHVKPDCGYPESCLRTHHKTGGISNSLAESSSTPLPIVSGRGLPQITHHFEIFNFKRPAYCGVCTKLLVGLVKQGLLCSHCGFPVHKSCSGETKYCREQDRVAFGHLSTEELKEKVSREDSIIRIDANVVQDLAEEGYDSKEVLAAIYYFCDKGIPYDLDAVRCRVLRNWGKKKALEQKSRMCVKCNNSEIQSLVLPCKHLCVCTGCTIDLKKCPVCSGKIGQIVQVFIPDVEEKLPSFENMFKT